MPMNQIDLSYLDALTEDEREAQAGVLKSRAYHAGTQQTFLTKRLRQFLQVDSTEQTFRMNFCRQVVNAVVERLVVEDFESVDDKVREWADGVWTANKLDARQNDIHTGAVRDGEGFVLVDWDAAAGRPRMLFHPRYTGTDVSYSHSGSRSRDSDATVGEGYGVKIFYPYDDTNQEPLYAVKRFADYTDKKLRNRVTVYYPERIEKYAYDGGWKPFQDEGDAAWPIPWLDVRGKPLGIPAVHFYGPELWPEAWDAFPIQDLIDKTLIDLLGASDITAFRLFVALGFIPTIDGKALASDLSNALDLQPGQIVGTTRIAGEADFKAIDGADLSGMLDVFNDQVIKLALVTNTPVSRFSFLKQIASAETLKGQEGPFVFKCGHRQTLFGYSWEAAFTLARKLQNLYGSEKINEEAELSVVWKALEQRPQAELFEEIKTKRESGVPREQLWAELGYTPEQIASFTEMPSYMTQQALLTAGMGGANG